MHNPWSFPLRCAPDKSTGQDGPSGQPSRTGLIDMARMRDLNASLGEGLREVIETYLEDTPHMIDDLRAACRRGDWQDLQRIAHSLKSSSGIFGAQSMVAQCRDLESCMDDQSSACEAQIQSVAREFDLLSQALASYLRQ